MSEKLGPPRVRLTCAFPTFCPPLTSCVKNAGISPLAPMGVPPLHGYYCRLYISSTSRRGRLSNYSTLPSSDQNMGSPDLYMCIICGRCSYNLLERSRTIDETGYLKWDACLALLLTWIICCLAVIKGVKTSGKV